MKPCITLMMLLASIHLWAQDPVHWTYSVKKIDAKSYELHIQAQIDSGWHIYSQTQPKDAIAQPTKIRINKTPLITLKGKIIEKGKLEKATIEPLDIQQYQYSTFVDFVQLAQLKGNAKTTLRGSVTFMACTDDRCLPVQEKVFALDL